MWQRLVDKRAPRDDHKVALRQDPVAGAVRIVALLRRPLKDVHRFCLLLHALRTMHMADERDGFSSQIDPVCVKNIHRDPDSAGLYPLRCVVKRVCRRKAERGLLEVPALHTLRRLSQAQSLQRRIKRRYRAARGKHRDAGGRRRLGKRPALAGYCLFNCFSARYAGAKRVIERKISFSHMDHLPCCGSFLSYHSI